MLTTAQTKNTGGYFIDFKQNLFRYYNSFDINKDEKGTNSYLANIQIKVT